MPRTIARIVTFKGTLSREDFFLSLLSVGLVAFIPIAVAPGEDPLSAMADLSDFVTLFYLLFCLLVPLGLAIRRLRDIGPKAGWTAFGVFVGLSFAGNLWSVGASDALGFLGVLGYLLFSPGWQDKKGVRHLVQALRVVADVNHVPGEEETEQFRRILQESFDLPESLQRATMADWRASAASPQDFAAHLQLFVRAVHNEEGFRSEAMRMLVTIASSGLGVSDSRSRLLEDAAMQLDVAPPLPTSIIAVLGMAARMAKADGRVLTGHVAVIDDFLVNTLSVSPPYRRSAIDAFNAAKSSQASFDEFAQLFMSVEHVDDSMRNTAFSLLLDLALVDGTISPAETAFLSAASKRLNIAWSFANPEVNQDDKEAANVVPPQSGTDAYYRKVLGVNPDATWEEIRKSYRSAVARNHPDKVVGLSSAIRDVAETETKRLNEAYQYFSDRARGR